MRAAILGAIASSGECMGNCTVLVNGPYVLTSATKADQLNTPASNKTTLSLGVDGRYLRIDYAKVGASANGTVLYVAINASSGTEADTILGSSSLGRYSIPIGSYLTLEFPADAPLRRLDFASDAASESANSSLVTYTYGVAV